MTFLFDAHNHIHMSIPGGVPPLVTDLTSQDCENHAQSICNSIMEVYNRGTIHNGLQDNEPPTTMYPIKGMALMSTQPRDFPLISHLSTSLPSKRPWDVIPCFGVHPWFLHIANIDFPLSNGTNQHHTDKSMESSEIAETKHEPMKLSHTQRLEYLQNKFTWYKSLVQQLHLHPQSQYVCITKLKTYTFLILFSNLHGLILDTND